MTFEFNAGGGDGLLDLTSFDHHQRERYPFTTAAAANPALSASHMANAGPAAWPPMAMDPMAAGPATAVSSPGESHHSHHSPHSHHSHSHSQSSSSSPTQHSASPLQPSPTFPGAAQLHSPQLLTDWTLLQHQQQHQHAPQDLSHFLPSNTLIPFNPFPANFQPHAALGYLPATTQALDQSMQPFTGMAAMEDPQALQHQWEGMGMANWQDFGASLQFPSDGLPRFSNIGNQSPTGTYLEVLSLPSTGSDQGWTTVDMYHASNFDSYPAQAPAQNAAIFNPGQTLHIRTPSDATHSDSLNFSSGSWEEVPFNYSPFSPSSSSETYSDPSNHRECFRGENHHHHSHSHSHSHSLSSQHSQQSHHHGHSHSHSHDGISISPSSAVSPLQIKPTASTTRSSPASGSGVASPPSNPTIRRNSGPRKSPIAKTTKSVTRRISNGKKDGAVEKKVGRRKGPLLPEQRKQASEIRKLRACLRCKFLKKTCDTGEPCGGCQPSHARLWQVPCTRIDIKDIGYFMKDWKADYERHLGRGVSVFNVKGFAQKETLMWITHGYGFCLPIMVREVFVADDSCFQADWVESYQPEQEPIEFELKTERLDVGEKGISTDALGEYLDKHIDNAFESFIDDHFEGTPFITEILKTAHRFYQKEKLPVLRKALKLVLAYNLTMHITLVESQGSEADMDGQIDDEDSKYYGKYVAPVMVNFQIKCAMADMWRELQKDILEELSALYSSVYSGDRLKNWPTIFMLASILLAVWEEMQFDCHYRVPDPAAVEKFCTDMETTPVGVITGLFHAISQKLPALADWDTERHGQLLNNNTAVCEALTEVRSHVLKHESYLRTRNTSKFDRYDFDSLSNKFLSKLVIKAN